MASRVLVTGAGVIAPNGIGKKRYWEAIVSGESGIREISRFDASGYDTKVAGEVVDFDPLAYVDRKKAKLLSRFAQFALAASRMAVSDAGIQLEHEDPYRMGIAVGTTVGGKEVDQEQQHIFHARGCRSMDPLTLIQISSNFAVGSIAVELGIKGPNSTVSTGCTSALNAIAYGHDLIKAGKADIVLAGGSEAPLVPVVFEAFAVAGVLSRRSGKPCEVSRPFEKNRDGYVLSEGCGVVVLENEEHARARKAEVYAEIAGYGVTNDGFSMLRMEPTGREAAKAIELALSQADTDPGEVDYINAHGSSSQVSDRRETNAVKRAFGERAYRIPVSSIKSMIGQPLGAAGALQVIAAAMAIRNKCIPPTINYEEQDPVCDLDYTPNRTRLGAIRTALVNCFGLGGNNTSMVLRQFLGYALCS